MLPQVFSKRERECPLSGENAPIVNYKNVALLKKFISERGKILPRRITSITAKKQRELAESIKLARNIALLPYVSNQ
ncbi:MAG: 30S ribosomal protein S18 [Rickettsiales bacterium]|nr:30S ribosomal protein S18 [Rickettsiales bacterium]